MCSPIFFFRSKEYEFRKVLFRKEVESVRFIGHGYVDTFRHCRGDVTGAYSWWSYRHGARSRNAGWRIDYFFVSEELRPLITDAWIDADVQGSDHCPVGLELDLP